jgi:large subunit ribosomal protein L4
MSSMKTKVLRPDGSETGRSAELDETIFGIDPNDHAIWLDVRRIQAHARQGTHKSKERSETAGSTRKLYRQKGTGHARAGDAKSPLRRSGGTFFGPKPHEYRLKVNKKTRRLARRSAFAHKAQAEALRVVENFEFEKPNTARMRDMLKAFEVEGRSVLVLTGANAPALYQSSRNLLKVRVRTVGTASTADVLRAQVVILQEGALPELSAALGSAATDSSKA